MMEPNAPETQEPQTPEPEEETEASAPQPKPLHPATILAAEAMFGAASALMRDPDTSNIDEAIHTVELVAELLAGAQPPEPTFSQRLVEVLDKNMPVLVQAAMQLGASYGSRGTITDCFPCGTPAAGPVFIPPHRPGRITHLDDYGLVDAARRRARFHVDGAGGMRDDDPLDGRLFRPGSHGELRYRLMEAAFEKAQAFKDEGKFPEATGVLLAAVEGYLTGSALAV